MLPITTYWAYDNINFGVVKVVSYIFSVYSIIIARVVDKVNGIFEDFLKFISIKLMIIEKCSWKICYKIWDVRGLNRGAKRWYNGEVWV